MARTRSKSSNNTDSDEDKNSVQSASKSVLKKPLIATALVVVAGLIILLFGVIAAFNVNSYNTTAILNNITNITNLTKQGITPAKQQALLKESFEIAAGIGIMCGIVVMAAGYGMYSGDQKRIKNFAIVALVFSIISIFGGGGSIIGMILGIIGSVIALLHK